MEDSQVWLPTPAAAKYLGRSESYLKRLRDTHGGFLEIGVHYCKAPSPNAPITWRCDLIVKELNKRALAFSS